MPDYGAAQGGGMGQMIQMIATLAEMQDRRKRMALDEHQLEVQQSQFAQRLGFDEKSEQSRNASKLIDLASKGGADGVTALYQLGKSMNLSEEQAQQISHVGMDAGAALQRIQRQQAESNLRNQQEGLASMTPGQRQTTQQEAANTSLTGMSQGQINTGQLIGQMAANAAQQITPGSQQYSQDMANRMGQAFMFQQGARQTPDQFAQGQAFIDKGMAPAAASIAGGLTPSAGQILSFQANQADITGRLAGQQASAAQHDLQGPTAALSAMHAISKDIADGKYANKDVMARMIREYNSFARLLSAQGITVPILDAGGSNAGEAVGRIEKWMQPLTGTNQPQMSPGGGRSHGPPPGGRY